MRPFLKGTCPVGDEVPATTPGGMAKEKATSTIPSSWEEIAALLKAVPYLTAPEPPTFGVKEFFTFFHHHFVNLGGNPHMVGVVRPSHVALNSTLRCIYLLLKYTVEETTEVVSFIPLLPKFA